MQRTYVITYHQSGRSHTMELSQAELDHILALGDAYPTSSNNDVSLKFDVVANSSDNRVWWNNSPLPSDVAEEKLRAGLMMVVPSSSAPTS